MKARLPKGMGGGPQDMNAMIKQAQKMQEDMKKIQEELDVKEYDVTVGGGSVTAKLNGKKEFLSINIAKEAVDPDDIEMLQDLIISAVNEGIRIVEADSDEEMQKVTGGLKI